MSKILKPLLIAVALLLATVASAPAQDGVFSLQGASYLRTAPVPTTDTNQKLTAAFATAYGSTVDWSLVKAAWITCETNDARIAFGAAAVNSGTVVGHILYAGQSMRIPSLSLIREANIISKTAGSAASLQVTLER